VNHSLLHPVSKFPSIICSIIARQSAQSFPHGMGYYCRCQGLRLWLPEAVLWPGALERQGNVGYVAVAGMQRPCFLRQYGITSPILILGPVQKQDLATGRQNNFTFVLNRYERPCNVEIGRSSDTVPLQYRYAHAPHGFCRQKSRRLRTIGYSRNWSLEGAFTICKCRMNRLLNSRTAARCV